MPVLTLAVGRLREFFLLSQPPRSANVYQQASFQKVAAATSPARGEKPRVSTAKVASLAITMPRSFETAFICTICCAREDVCYPYLKTSMLISFPTQTNNHAWRPYHTDDAQPSMKRDKMHKLGFDARILSRILCQTISPKCEQSPQRQLEVEHGKQSGAIIKIRCKTLQWQAGFRPGQDPCVSKSTST